MKEPVAMVSAILVSQTMNDQSVVERIYDADGASMIDGNFAGVPEHVVQTELDSDFKETLVRLRTTIAEATRALNSREVPIRSRETLQAFLNGDFADFAIAVDRRSILELAGANVIAVSFGTYANRRRIAKQNS